MVILRHDKQLQMKTLNLLPKSTCVPETQCCPPGVIWGQGHKMLKTYEIWKYRQMLLTRVKSADRLTKRHKTIWPSSFNLGLIMCTKLCNNLSKTEEVICLKNFFSHQQTIVWLLSTPFKIQLQCGYNMWGIEVQDCAINLNVLPLSDYDTYCYNFVIFLFISSYKYHYYLYHPAELLLANNAQMD